MALSQLPPPPRLLFVTQSVRRIRHFNLYYFTWNSISYPPLPSHTLYFCLRLQPLLQYITWHSISPLPTLPPPIIIPPSHILLCYLYPSNKTYPLQSLLHGKERMRLPHHAPFPSRPVLLFVPQSVSRTFTSTFSLYDSVAHGLQSVAPLPFPPSHHTL